jgi:hypothetical protein
MVREVTNRDTGGEAMKKAKRGGVVDKARKVRIIKKAEPRRTSAGKARAEGMRLFNLAGRPKREDFLVVFGKNGDRLTWEERAKTAGLPSAERAAAQFQSLLAKAAK